MKIGEKSLRLVTATQESKSISDDLSRQLKHFHELRFVDSKKRLLP